MTTLFLTCLAVGGAVLVAQLVLSLVGIGADGDGDVGKDLAHDVHGPAHGAAGASGGPGSDPLLGLHLFSVRSLAAAVAFFGVGGLAAGAAGAAAPLALLAGVAAGVAASLATAWAMRAMLRLERDGTVRIERALGEAATVYVPIPAGGGTPGKIHLTLQGRTVECQAVTPGPDALPTGTRVTVVDVRTADLVEVVPTPSIDGAP